MKRLTLDDARQEALLKGGECLSIAYIDNRTHLKWKCAAGHTFEKTLDHIKEGSWCSDCSGKKKKDIVDCVNLAASKGGVCLSTTYINRQSKLEWMCAAGHTLHRSYADADRGRWCSRCDRYLSSSPNDSFLTKKCEGCGEIKTLSEFSNTRQNKSGKLPDCKVCVKKKREQVFETNKDKIRQQNTTRHKNRCAKDIDYKIRHILRGRLSKIISGESKSASAVKDLGCSIEELKTHIEKKFYSNPETGETMTWENHGLYGWHLDHIKPLASFNLLDTEQVKKACHYTNLQPLWAKENLSKGARLITT